MIIDNSWVVSNMKQMKKKEWLTTTMKELNLTWFKTEWDSTDSYSIVPKKWTYYFNYITGRHCMNLDISYRYLYLYNIKYKNEAIKLINILEKQYNVEYTLYNRTNEVIEL